MKKLIKKTSLTSVKNPIFDKKRPLSWSAISSFEWDKNQWYKRYVLKEDSPVTKELTFGKEIGERLAFDPKFLPEVPREAIFEHRLLTEFDGIPLVGYVDSLSLDYKVLREFKTGKKIWDKKRADGHGQLDMYLLMIYLMYRIRPEEIQCFLHWLPTEESLLSMDAKDSTISFMQPFMVHTFEVEKTMNHILTFGNRIKKTYKEMSTYAQSYPQIDK